MSTYTYKSYSASESDAIINHIIGPIILTICRMCFSYCTDGLSWINHKFHLKSENWFPILGGMGWIFLIPSPEVIKCWQRHLVTYLVNIGLPVKSTLTHGRIWQSAEIGPAEPQNRGLNPPTAFMFPFPPSCLRRKKWLDSGPHNSPNTCKLSLLISKHNYSFCFFYIIFKNSFPSSSLS